MLHEADMYQTPDCAIAEQHHAKGTQISFFVSLFADDSSVCFNHAGQRRVLIQMTNAMKNRTNIYLCQFWSFPNF